MHMGMRCWVRPLTLGITYATLVAATLPAQEPLRVSSPDGRNDVTVEVRDGKLYYSLQRDKRAILLPSMLCVEFQGTQPLRDSLRVTGRAERTVDQTWTQPWGEVARVHDNHRE